MFIHHRGVGWLFVYLLFLATGRSLGSPLDYSFAGNGPPVNADWYIAQSSREYISLGGGWEYSENGDTWNSVIIPSVFEGEKNLHFKRSFEIPEKFFPYSSFQLLSFGINYYCEVSINGQFIGKHAGATPFLFKIPDTILKPGRNNIDILVSNELNVGETVPLSEQSGDPKNYGGIFRKLGIMITGKTWSDDGHVEIRSMAGARQLSLMYSTTIHTGTLSALSPDSSRSARRLSKRTVEHVFEIIDIQTGTSLYRSEPRSLELESDRAILFTAPFSLSDIHLWSPSAPALYLLRRTLSIGGRIVDDVYQTIGFRTLETKNGSLFLNGEVMFLRGIMYHEYSPATFSALSEEDIERDILLMKNLGANAVRVRAGSLNPYLLSTCDRYGLLVLYDIPLYATPSPLLREPSIQSTILNRISDIVSWYASRPSMAGIGLACGVDGQSLGHKEYFSRIMHAAKARNSYLVYASFASPAVDTSSYGSLDFISLDLPPSSLESTSRLIDHWAALVRELRVPVFIGSLEFQVDVDNYNGYSDPRSIDAQAKFFLDLYPMIREKGFRGCFINSFSDWRGAKPLLQQVPDRSDIVTTGLVDTRRQKRLTYDVIKVLFNNEKPPTLVIGNYSVEYPPVFIITGIITIFLFALMYNLFKRFRENVVRAVLRPYNFFADVRDQRLLSTFQTTAIGLLGALSVSLYMTNLLHYWKNTLWCDFVVSQFLRSSDLKGLVNFFAWYPLLSILAGTILVFLVHSMYAIILRFFSLLLKKKLLLFDTYSVSMWAILPMVFLAPIGMILHRILTIPVVEIIAPILLGVLCVWTCSRILKGTAIVLEVRTIYIYLMGYAVIVAVVALWIGSLDRQYGVLEYLRYGWNSFFYYHSIS